MSIERQKVIAAVLIHHATIGSGCSCGHRFRIGDSMSAHRAEAIDAALDLIDQGLATEPQIVDLVQYAGTLRTDAPIQDLGAEASVRIAKAVAAARAPHVGIAATYAANAITVP